jgi:anaerobic selenocysteine-containing dehydrogenase
MSDDINKSKGVPGLLSRLNEKLFGSPSHTLKKSSSEHAVEEDVWLHTGCRMCTQPRCGMRVHRKNGIIVETEGDPNHPMNNGTLCVRGQANIFNLYNPYRVKAPMKRTNPKKGFDEDPGWVEISWEEAMNIVIEKLKEIHETDPRQLALLVGFGSFGDDLPMFRAVLPNAFGTPNLLENNGPMCPVHWGSLIFHGEFVENIDAERCDYLINIGQSIGSRLVSAAGETRSLEDAKDRGMKTVVVDPHWSSECVRGEWVPLKPNTALAFELAMIHVMLFELQKFDEWFVKYRTNCPYLIKPDGGYAREQDGYKPLMWDSQNNKPVTFDDPDINERLVDVALEGSFTINGETVKPAFLLLKESVKSYTPEWAEEISTIPAETTRRITAEFVEAAQIGSNIEIDGFTFPYRPVAINAGRGPIASSSGTYAMTASNIINGLVGAADGPGNTICQTIGPTLKPDEDGVVRTWAETTPHVDEWEFNEWHYTPQSIDMAEFYPHRHSTTHVAWRAIVDPEKYHLDYEVKMMMVYGANPFFNIISDGAEEAFKKIPFTVDIAYSFDETSQFADILLVENSNLERLGFDYIHKVTRATDDLRRRVQGHNTRQPVLPRPLYNTRDSNDMCLEIINRLGIKGPAYGQTSGMMKLKGTGFELDPSKDYTWEEVFGRCLKAWHKDKDKAFFLKNGCLQDETYVRLRESYPYYFHPDNKTRHPMYDEHIRYSRERMKKLCTEHDVSIPGWDMDEWEKYFQPLPHWFVTSDWNAPEEYDLLAVNWKTAARPFGTSGLDDNALIQEIKEFDPEIGFILINTETAKRKGLKDGDMVRCESLHGSLEGPIKTTELLQADSVGISGNYGQKGRLTYPEAKKGLNYNVLLSAEDGEFDPVTGGINISPQVKLTKI